MADVKVVRPCLRLLMSMLFSRIPSVPDGQAAMQRVEADICRVDGRDGGPVSAGVGKELWVKPPQHPGFDRAVPEAPSSV